VFWGNAMWAAACRRVACVLCCSQQEDEQRALSVQASGARSALVGCLCRVVCGAYDESEEGLRGRGAKKEGCSSHVCHLLPTTFEPHAPRNLFLPRQPQRTQLQPQLTAPTQHTVEVRRPDREIRLTSDEAYKTQECDPCCEPN